MDLIVQVLTDHGKSNSIANPSSSTTFKSSWINGQAEPSPTAFPVVLSVRCFTTCHDLLYITCHVRALPVTETRHTFSPDTATRQAIVSSQEFQFRQFWTRAVGDDDLTCIASPLDLKRIQIQLRVSYIRKQKLELHAKATYKRYVKDGRAR